MTTVTYADIEKARNRIRDSVYTSPCVHSEILSDKLGCKLYLKLENLQKTGSFKDRGALNKMLQLNKQQKAAGVITASAGNHAQGVAHAARMLGIPATIVMPETTPLAKIKRTKELGARIILHGSGYDEAFEKASQLQQENDLCFVHAFDDPQIIAGQGTIGLELLEQLPDMDMVIVPIGGGGLISGIGSAIKHRLQDVRIIGVEAERMPAMLTSVKNKKIIALRPANTIADGISVAKVGKSTLPLVHQHVENIVTVNEESIAHAVMTLLEYEKTLSEGAGAVGIAALNDKLINNIEDKKVVVVISGGNIDMTMLAKILDRGMEKDGRLARIKVIVPDRPGNIAELAIQVARHKANILEIFQNRSVTEVDLGETEVELLLEARGWEHIEAIIESISKSGYTVKN